MKTRDAAETTATTAHGPVCLLADDPSAPGVLTVVLEPGVAIEVVELERLGDKCVVQLRYKVTAERGAPGRPGATLPLAA